MLIWFVLEPDSALEIFKRRYAAGELTLENYRTMAEEISCKRFLGLL